MPKRVYRLYGDEGLIVRTKQRKIIARRGNAFNQCCTMDLITNKLADGRPFRIVTVLDQFTRECICLEADRPMSGAKVAAALTTAAAELNGFLESITCDDGLNASENFSSERRRAYARRSFELSTRLAYKETRVPEMVFHG